jgi:hypothetical protein
MPEDISVEGMLESLEEDNKTLHQMITMLVLRSRGMIPFTGTEFDAAKDWDFEVQAVEGEPQLARLIAKEL